jgi:hypothetical protein
MRGFTVLPISNRYLVLSAFAISVCLAQSASALIAKDGKVTLERLNEYDFCQSKDYDGTWCDKALDDWVALHPGDAFQAGKMTRKHMQSWVALRFFKLAFDAKKGDCKDEDVKLAVLSGLNNSASSQPEVVATAKKIGLEVCQKEMSADIVKAAKEDAYTFANTCKELQAKKLLQLGSIQAAKCAKGD